MLKQMGRLVQMALFLAMVLGLAGQAGAELSLDELRAKFEAAWEREKLESGTRELKLRDGYIGALERLKTTLGKEEKLEQAKIVLGEIEVIKGVPPVPDLPENADYRLKGLRSKWVREREKLDGDLQRATRGVAETYLKVLEERKRSLTRSGEIREASWSRAR